ncbi:MAG: tetratricopeptide repeat protein [Kiritimatiellae bacterium]|nr:tetratricopeptide repeat protein [Kiritimatiellia bacterium]
MLLASVSLAFCAEPPGQAIDKAKALFDAGKWGEAGNVLEEYARRRPAPPRLAEALVLQGRCHERRGDFAAAQKIYSRVAHDDAMLRKDPDAVAMACDRLHALLVSQGAPATTRKRFIEEARLRVRSPDAQARIREREGAALVAADDIRGALASYRAAPTLSEPGRAALSLLEAVAAPARKVADADIESLSKLAVSKPDLVRPLCRALSRCRDGWRAEDFLATHCLACGRGREAAEIWKDLSRRKVGPVDAIAYSYCEALAEFDASAAMRELDRWLAAHPLSPLEEKAHLARARLESAHGDLGRAIALFEEFLGKYPHGRYSDVAGRELAEARKAASLLEAQRAREEERAEAMEKDPLLAKVEAGEALLRQRRYKEAARLFNSLKAIAGQGLRGRVLLGLGEAMRGNGDSRGALETLRAVARSGAASTNGAYAARANRAIGDIRLEDTGDYDGAVAAYGKFLAMRPDLAGPGFWMNYGLALMASGRGEEAAQVFSRRRDQAVGDPAEFAKWDNMVKKCGQGREWQREAVQERGALAAMDVAEALLDGDEAGRALKIFRRVLPVARRLGLGDRCAIGEAQCLAALGRDKAALKAYDEFAKKHPKSPMAPRALLRAGVLCASPAMNDFREARKRFDAIVGKYPSSREAEAAEFYSATLAWRDGKWAEAGRLHRAFAERHPGSPLARVATEERLPAIAAKSLEVPAKAQSSRSLSAIASPNGRIRHSLRIDQSASCNAIFRIYPESGWKIVSTYLRRDSRGAGALWTGPNPRTRYQHAYHLSDAFSSQEFAMIDGKLVPSGEGKDPKTWPFRVTVPSVDVDWSGLGSSYYEDGEDTQYALIPLNPNGSGDIRNVLLKSPYDDDERQGRPGFAHGSRVSPTVTLEWSPVNSVSLLRDGTTSIPSGWSVNAEDVSRWPISFTTVPQVTSGEFTVSCEGQYTGWGKALDRIHGRFVNVDLDIDANCDGAITDDDEAIEVSKGGIVGVAYNGLVPIKLAIGPASLSGRATLAATSGADHIKVWADRSRMARVTLPKTWNNIAQIPQTLYVEGISPSASLRDIKLMLRYDENPAGQTSALLRCDDTIALTVVRAEMELYKPKVIDPAGTMIPMNEKLTIGCVTFVNIDNDDHDAYFDNGGPSPDDDVAGGDDELVKVKLKITPSGIADGQVRLLAMSGANTVSVWTNDTKDTSSSYVPGTPLNVSDDFSVENRSLVKTFWVEGIAAHAFEREAILKVEYSTINTVSSDLAALTVIGVESVSWKGRGNSLNETDSLDADPNWPSGLSPAALRVFPGARIENGAVGAARDKVDVEVSLSAAPPHPITVYLRSFDVDDPTDDSAPVDNEANEEDNRGATPKRAGAFTGESGGVFELQFNAGQKTATCEFQTTMQPGDNFRVVANGDKDFLLDLENKDSSQNTGGTTSIKNANKQRICDKNIPGNPSDKEIRFPLQYASPVLTVWRLLHIEVDSMAAPPSSGTEKNFVEGNLTSVASFGTVAERVGIDINLRTGLTPPDNSANMTAGTRNGRFENGWIKIGSGSGTPGQTMTSGLDGNGDDFVERLAGIDIPVVVTKTGQPDITGKVWEWNGNRFVLCSLSANLSSSYNGGTLNVAGVSSAIATIASPNIVNVTSVPTIPFVLHDDDDDTVLPSSIALDNLMESDLPTENRMATLFIRPSHDGGGNLSNNQNNVPFVRNTERSDVYRWQSHSNNMRRFWVAYFLAAFQDSKSTNQTDFDPNSETGAWASANNEPLLSGVLFYQESQRDGNLSRQWKSRISVHELGHNFGLHDRYGSIKNDGIMHGYTEGQPSMNYFWGKQDAAVIRSMPVPY